MEKLKRSIPAISVHRTPTMLGLSRVLAGFINKLLLILILVLPSLNFMIGSMLLLQLIFLMIGYSHSSKNSKFLYYVYSLIGEQSLKADRRLMSMSFICKLKALSIAGPKCAIHKPMASVNDYIEPCRKNFTL